ncbi:MAG: aminoacyl-histidine dipeptidase [Abitibacteriaceae bacterium]|nr:aminoacyl-histidine dipeptidase [Abditibacteriaceae bacterium]MBV9868634.1 aminoacyl-histidine dipeptidase [Abditibacteriaceae bacterium]
MTYSDAYNGLEPQELWRHFDALNHIPRPSGAEAAARAYVQQVAQEFGATSNEDERGNMVVRVPATMGRENAPTVAIQAHLDMVCEKRPDVVHDFATDPIRPQREGDRILASGTTLGADNGIGAAAALALLTQPGLEHGPLELLFTVDEETGLHGAMALDPSLVTSRMLINLDSEDPDELTIGCAGGAGTVLHLPVTFEPTPPGWVGREVVVSGLRGGHSGVQIHEHLANAIKLLMGALLYIQDSGDDFGLAAIHGGSAHNAIPRDAWARLAVGRESLAMLERIIPEVARAMRNQWGDDEPDLALTVREMTTPNEVITRRDFNRLLNLLDDLPHGVINMSQVFPGKVETSTNLAVVETREGQIEIATSSRSFLAEELQKVQNRIASNGRNAGAEVEVRDGYPGWEPVANSRLLQVTDEVYRQIFRKAPQVQVVHAGLECGVIVSKIPGMEAISFGPTIRGAHTPEEHVYISTVASIWRLLVALLATLSAR